MSDFVKVISNSLQEKGLESIRQAKEKEFVKNYSEAFRLYKQGLEYLLAALKCEEDEERQQSIKQTAEKYLANAEVVKNKLLSLDSERENNL